MIRRLTYLFLLPFILLATPKGAAPQNNKPTLGRINIAGVPVNGLTPDAARRRVARRLNKRLNTRLILTDGYRKVWRTRRQLGLRVDVDGMIARARAGQKYVPLRFAVNVAVLQRALRRIAPRFTFAGRDARLREINSKGNVRVVPPQAARHVDVARSAHDLAEALKRNPGLRIFRLAVKRTPRKLKASQFKGITGRLSRFTTRFDPGNTKRTRNMRLAIKSIDGTLLSPGEVFSLNKVVGERTQARGYRTATVFESGYRVPGIGAGVSQVTGTIFNAALLAGLPIVTYRTHSRPVAYLPIGRDATVSYGNFDMKFKNNTTAPIYISYKISGNRATATLYGKRIPGQRVRLTARVQYKGPRRITAQLYRTIRRNGKVVSKEKVGSSHYNWKVETWD